MKTLSTSFKLSKSEFLNGNNTCYFQANPRKWAMIAVWLFLLIVAGFNLYFGIILKDSTSLILGVIILIMPILFEFLRRWRLARFYDKAKVCSEEISYIIDEEKIKRQSESYSTEYKISSLNKVIKSKNWIFLFPDNGQGNLIPENAFTQENIYILKEILNKHQVKNNL